MTTWIKTTAVFRRPFRLPSIGGTLPAGEYEIETRRPEPLDRIEPGLPASPVVVRLRPRSAPPGPDRTLMVPLVELESAIAGDSLTGRALTDLFLEEMLADPMIRLVMQADGVVEADLRELYAPRPDETRAGPDDRAGMGAARVGPDAGQGSASVRPGIGG